jgi:hypothetical protein
MDGEKCSFDAFLKVYDIRDPALDTRALIVRGADTESAQACSSTRSARPGRFSAPVIVVGLSPCRVAACLRKLTLLRYRCRRLRVVELDRVEVEET